MIDTTINTPQVRRDQWGRYKVLPPAGSKPEGYTRATTIAKTLDDGSGLIGWGKRMVALGLSGRPDLVALVGATDDTDKKELDKICERAAEAGGATIRRDLGTALHAMLENSWTIDGYTAPAPYTADVAAVHQALKNAGLSVVENMTERMIVNDHYKIAGTFDLILTDGNTNYISDIKTGSSLMGALAFSIQLAIYAGADNLYTQGAAADGSDDIREPMPQLDDTRGVIIHVQPASGKCDLHWIDLDQGLEALEVAIDVRGIRKAKVLSRVEPSDPLVFAQVDNIFPGTVTVQYVTEEWRDWVRPRIAAIIAAGGAADMVREWPPDVPTLKEEKPITEGEGDAIEEKVCFVEKMFGIPFPEPAPGVDYAPERLPEPVQRVTIDEGRDIPDRWVIELNNRANMLTPVGREWLIAILGLADVAKLPIRMSGAGGRATDRRLLICNSIVEMADHADDQLARAIITQATGTHTGGHDLGTLFGQLDFTESQNVQRVAAAVNTGILTATWHDDHVTLAGNFSVNTETQKNK